MKKTVFLSIVACSFLYSAEPMNKSLLKNRANYAEDNGGVYGNKMYIYKDAVETQREINEQIRSGSRNIEIASPTIDRNSKVRGVETLVEGGNLNIIGRNADVNIASPKIAPNSGVKEINTAVNLNNINLLANTNNTVNIAAPTVSGSNPLTVINTNVNLGSLNTAANQNMTANIGSATIDSMTSVKSLSTNVTVSGAVKVNSGSTVNVGGINVGKRQNSGASSSDNGVGGTSSQNYVVKPVVLNNSSTSGVVRNVSASSTIGNIYQVDTGTSSTQNLTIDKLTPQTGRQNIFVEIFNEIKTPELIEKLKDRQTALENAYKAMLELLNNPVITNKQAKDLLPYLLLLSGNIPSNYKQLADISEKTSGLDANVYYDSKTKKLVVAFQGTESREDIKANMGSEFNEADFAREQYEKALKLIEIIKNKPKVKELLEAGGSLELTGYSLGGSIAEYVGAATGLTTYAFNPSAIPDELYKTKGLGKDNPNINIIRSALDTVSSSSMAYGSEHLSSKIVNVPGMNTLGNQHSINDLITGLKNASNKTDTQLKSELADIQEKAKNKDSTVGKIVTAKLESSLNKPMYGLQEWASKVGSATSKTVQQGADVTLKIVQKGVDVTSKTVQQGADVTLKTVQQGADVTLKTVQQGVDVTLKTVQQGADVTLKIVQKGVDVTSKTVQQGADVTLKIVQKGVDITLKTADLVDNYTDAFKITKADAQKTVNEIKELVKRPIISKTMAQNALEYSKLSEMVYQPNGVYTGVDKDKNPKFYKKLDFEDNPNGMQVAVYYDQKHKKIVFAYRGTEPKSNGDIINDVALALNKNLDSNDSQFNSALKFFQDTIKKPIYQAILKKAGKLILRGIRLVVVLRSMSQQKQAMRHMYLMRRQSHLLWLKIQT